MKLKKLFALLLCAAMLLSVLPMGTLAGLLSVDGSAPAQQEEPASGGFLTVDNSDEPEEEPHGFLTVEPDEPGEEEHHGYLTVEGDEPDDGDEDDQSAPVIPAPSQVYICEWCGWADGYHADDCPSHVEEEQPEEPSDAEPEEPKPDKSEVRAYAPAANSFADIFEALLAAADLEEYEAILNELDDEQLELFFDLLDDDELEALAQVEAELAYAAVTEYQPVATEVLTEEARAEAYFSAYALALAQVEAEADSDGTESTVTCTCAAEDDEHTETCALTVAALYQALLACETCDEMNDIAAAATDAQRELLTEDMLAAIQEHYVALEEAEEAEEEPVPTTVTGDYAPPFTSAGPLIRYDTDDEDDGPYGWYSAFDYSTFGVSTYADEGGNNTTNGGLVLNKTAAYNEETKDYTITLEAYATGESVTTYQKEGVDIVLMLDLSQYMGKAETTTNTTKGTVASSMTLSELKTSAGGGTKYYYLNNGIYYEVEIKADRGTYSISYSYWNGYNTTTQTIVNNKQGNTTLNQAGDRGSTVTLYTDVTTTTTTYDVKDEAKLSALKEAVNNFIDKVAKESPSSRIAIVTYAGEATVKTSENAEDREATNNVATEDALVKVDTAADVGALNAIVSGLSIAGKDTPSNSHYAAADAVKIFQSVPTNSTYYSRPRVAILFSAGIPGNGWTSNSEKTGGKDIAQATMHLSTILKTSKNNDAKLPTSDNDYSLDAANVDGGATWSNNEIKALLNNNDGWDKGCGATVYCVGLDIPSSGDPSQVDMSSGTYKSGALANEYFWRISSHRKDGTHIFAGYSNSNQYKTAVEAAYSYYSDTTGESAYRTAGEWYDAAAKVHTYTTLYYFYPDVLTRNQTDGYYLTTTSTVGENGEGGIDKLNKIFEGIGSQVVNSESVSTELDASTVIKDIMSPQFQLPKNTEAENITVKVEKYNGPNNWEDVTNSFSDKDKIKVTVTKDDDDKDVVDVTGFNFSKHWCGTSTDGDEVTNHGYKLVIRFTVVPKEGFLGGNNVPTNDADSGVYRDSKATEPLQPFPQPGVSITPSIEVGEITSNVYLGGFYSQTISAEDIRNAIDITVGGVDLDLTEPNYGLQEWQSAYVDITVTVKDSAGHDLTDAGIDKLTEDVTYTISVTVTPKGDEAGKPTTAEDTIHVFKPELTYKDSEVWYGGTAPTQAELAENLTCTRWVHKVKNTDDSETIDKVAGEGGVTMLGDATAPTLTITYTTPEGAITGTEGNRTIDTPNDIPVDVKVEIVYGTEVEDGYKEWDVTQYVTFEHTSCEDKSCNFPDGVNGKFWLHVKTCSLTISKKWEGSSEYYQDAVFKVSSTDGTNLNLVIHPGTSGINSITISGLKVGTYTVTEDTDWAWRYTSTSSGSTSTTLGEGTQIATISFTNTLKNKKWLDGNAVANNVYEQAQNGTASASMALWPEQDDKKQKQL